MCEIIERENVLAGPKCKFSLSANHGDRQGEQSGVFRGRENFLGIIPL